MEVQCRLETKVAVMGNSVLAVSHKDVPQGVQSRDEAVRGRIRVEQAKQCIQRPLFLWEGTNFNIRNNKIEDSSH